MASPVLVTLIMTCKPDLIESVCQSFETVLVDTRKAKGFISISVHRNDENPNQIILVESWETREDYDAYSEWRMSGDGRANFLALLDGEPRLDFWSTRVA